MGHRARGLHRRRQCLGLFPPRSCAQPRLSLGRGRHRRLRRRPAALCLGLALWNGRDPILKERLFGLTNGEGNHGEDVKELYYYLDAHAEPCLSADALQISAGRLSLRAAASRRIAGAASNDREYELHRHRRLRRGPLFRRRGRICQGGARRHPDAGHRRQSRPRRGRRCMCCRSSGRATPGRGRADAPTPAAARPRRTTRSTAAHPSLPRDALASADGAARAAVLRQRDQSARGSAASDAGRLLQGRHQRLRRRGRRARGQPGAGRHQVRGASPARRSPAGGNGRACACGCRPMDAAQRPFGRFRRDHSQRRRAEADAFYAALQRRHRRSGRAPRAAPGVRRHALVEAVLLLRRSGNGSTATRRSRRRPQAASTGRNAEWEHLNNADIISMPDKWEYPWYAAWDLAFHCVAAGADRSGVRQATSCCC